MAYQEVLPSANPAENQYITAKLVSAVASKVVDNMHSFFSACVLGGIPDDDLKNGGPPGSKFRVPLGISDVHRVYSMESYEFDFDSVKSRYTRQFEISGIIGLWVRSNSDYYMESFVKPLIVSMINEASIRQFNKFLENALIYSDSAFNVLSSISGSLECGATPEIEASLGTPSSIRYTSGMADVQAQQMHNQAINTLGLLGTGHVSAVGNIYSSKALSGVASWNQESLGSRILSKFTVVNQGTQSVHQRAQDAYSACFMYADVQGKIEGPISLLKVVRYITAGSTITKLVVKVNPKAVGILNNICDTPNKKILLAKGEAVSACGAGAARYVYRAGEYLTKNPGEGGTFLVNEDVPIDMNSTNEISIEVRPVPLSLGSNYLDDIGDFAPVMTLNTATPSNVNLYSFDAPVIQQNCKGIKTTSWPWIISDPMLFMNTATPYQYIRPPQMRGRVESKTETWENQQSFVHSKNSIEMMLYTQGDVVTNKDMVRLEMYVDVGMNNKTYSVGMIPRVVNYFDFYDQEPTIGKNSKAKLNLRST
jgi:hypothetical protein